MHQVRISPTQYKIIPREKVSSRMLDNEMFVTVTSGVISSWTPKLIISEIPFSISQKIEI